MNKAAAIAAAFGGGLPPGISGTNDRCTLLASSLNPDMIDEDKLFNLFSLYGNIVRIKLLRKPDHALIQMGDVPQAESAMHFLKIGISPMMGLAQYKPDHALIQMGDGFQAESAVHFLKVFEMNGKKQALVLFENEKQATKALVCKRATALGNSMIRICVLILLKMLSEYIDMNTVLPALSYEVLHRVSS
ncbi:polypyrimidine tract-binding protein homolog 3 [Tanacetum coccineum]